MKLKQNTLSHLPDEDLKKHLSQRTHFNNEIPTANSMFFGVGGMGNSMQPMLCFNQILEIYKSIRLTRTGIVFASRRF